MFPSDYAKLNVDAASDQELLQGSTGAGPRGSKGLFIREGNWIIDTCIDVLSDEAIALKLGLQLAQSMGCNRLMINSNNMDVIDIMNDGGKT